MGPFVKVLTGGRTYPGAGLAAGGDVTWPGSGPEDDNFKVHFEGEDNGTCYIALTVCYH